MVDKKIEKMNYAERILQANKRILEQIGPTISARF